MGIYRCQYSNVTTQGENIESCSKQMSLDLSTYDENLKSNLSPWGEKDTARPSFDAEKDKLLADAQKYAEFGEKLGQHIQDVSTRIGDLDKELASLKI